MMKKLSAATKDDQDSEVVKDHRALQNQSSVKATDYPVSQRKAQSLVPPKRKKPD